MFQMAIGTCQFAKSITCSATLIVTPYPTPPCPKKLIGSGRFPQVALVGAGEGSGPLDPPPRAAPDQIRSDQEGNRLIQVDKQQP